MPIAVRCGALGTRLAARISCPRQLSFKYSDFNLVALWLLYALPFGRERKRRQTQQNAQGKNSDAVRTIDLFGQNRCFACK
jgi:hypothetical protein